MSELATVEDSRNVIVIGNPDLGVLAPSWRLKETLEILGYGVFYFSAHTWPLLFQGGVAHLAFLRNLINRWDVKALVLADGVQVDAEQSDVLDNLSVVVYALDQQQCRCSLDSLNTTADLVICASDMEHEGRFSSNLLLPLAPDAKLRSTVLANDIALSRGYLCLQEFTPERLACLQGLADSNDTVVRCLGDSWPEEIKIRPDYSSLAYAMGFSNLLIYFDEGDGEPAPLQRYLMMCGSIIGDASVLVLSRDDMGYRVECGGPISYGAFLERYNCEAEDAAFEQFVASAFDSLFDGEASFIHCRIATLFGYVGKGNFGDEYILSTIAKRLNLRCPGTILLAVGEDPWHTLVHRGIYSIGLEDSFALDRALEASSIALVMAGLLFDQGVRWTMGKGELVSTQMHSDLPGIASFCQVALLNDTPVFFYGIGAGPLDLRDGKLLVRYMGSLGARFLARDEMTAKAVLAAGVSPDQVARRADVAFTATSEPSAYADQWLIDHGVDYRIEKLIVVSLRDYENVVPGFDKTVARALDSLGKRYQDARFLFCILDQDDIVPSQAVIDAMELSDRTLIFNPGDDIDAIAGMLVRCYGGLSMRYHCSLILARSGVPCVGLGYLPKVVSLYRECGLGNHILRMDADSDEIFRHLVDLFEGREFLLSRIEKGVGALGDLANESEDEVVACLEAGTSAARLLSHGSELYQRNITGSSEQIDYLRWRAWVLETELQETTLQLEEKNRYLEKKSSEADALRAEVDELRNSTSFKIGSKLTYLPGKLKALIQK